MIKIWSVENVAISGLRPEPRQRFTEREKIPRPVHRFLMRKFAVLTRSPFGTVEIDRASLSCIVMQPPENDSDAFFRFGLVFSYLFVFFASERV
ncbi:hypothetical protein DRU03_24895 [Salmonella enterica subsp. enterica serovar Typhimurium]|nr:hypothetical protein [Salmonella enterica subsp. enterica serovar Typhimurium]EBX3552244.1 hypothetical protein [Salmonella enterica subsp. enterica serovar Typhimurium]MDN0430778.1 hypothetical protein [Escherichia coli]